MVTRKDVAKRAGVSVATVSRVTSGIGYVSEENRKRVTDVIRALDYIPNRMATNLSRNKSNIVAVLVEDLTNQYYLQILDAMSREAKKQGRIISMFSVNENEIDEVVENLIANRVCAIINLALFPLNRKYIRQLGELDVCTVNIGAEGDNRLHLDYESGMREMFSVLSEMGRKKLAYISGLPKELAEHDGRLLNYRKLVAEFGFCEDEELVLFGDYPKRGGFDVGAELCERLYDMEKRPDAIFCMNDVVALGVCNALHRRGVRIPEEVSIIGCDNIVMSRYAYPALATLDMAKEEQGKAYMEAVKRGNSKREFVFHSTLVVRESMKK